MLDNEMDRTGERDIGRERTNRPADGSHGEGGDQGLPDREVPLTSVTTADVINRWLDGEMTEPTGLRGDAARTVEFWRRIGEETDRRRRLATPVHLQAKIMAALPEAAPRTADWWRRDAKVTAGMLLAAGAALLALGAVVVNLLRTN
ncbi:MAG: hypothetical protein ACT4R6_10860 [Gemmatimonadaceae bacterium]